MGAISVSDGHSSSADPLLSIIKVLSIRMENAWDLIKPDELETIFHGQYMGLKRIFSEYHYLVKPSH